MRGVLAIASREFAGFFRQPMGWVVIALYLALSGAVFALGSLQPGSPATLRGFFAVSTWLLLFVAPAASMRLLADEQRVGTLEPLMTSPVSDWAIVVGKYLGAAGFLLAMLAPTLVYVGVLEVFADPDYGPIGAGYLGLVLVGALYLSVGLLFSTLTDSQIVAFLASLFFFLLLRIATLQGAAYLGDPWAQYLYPLSIDMRMGDFAKGVIDTSHVVFFLVASAWFLVLSGAMLTLRRWR
ncbi:MAG: ABC transporter permease subunit [Phycisphaeraceae bacterium]|nr:ABC transporter permease subunit [Phycisphaeraceae bacterium]